MKKIKKYLLIFLIIVAMIQLFLVAEIYFNQGKELKIKRIDATHYKAKIGVRGIDLSIEKDSLNNYDIEINKFPDFSFGDGLYFFNAKIGYETKLRLKRDNIYEIQHDYEVRILKYLIIFQKRWNVNFVLFLNEKNIEKSIIIYELE